MRVTVDAHALRNALGRLKPRTSRFRSLREAGVEITVEGDALVLSGTLDSQASVPAAVDQGGAARIPLTPAIRLLGTYGKGASVVIWAEPGKVWFDRFAFITPEGVVQLDGPAGA